MHEGFRMRLDLGRRTETLAQWMFEANYLVVFTGAGCSTESGLPDFRGPMEFGPEGTRVFLPNPCFLGIQFSPIRDT